MVKFQLISDLHLEKFKVLPNVEEIITPSAPNLILAGDICYVKHKNFIPFFEKISELYNNIYYVLGNHEYYDDIESGFYSMGDIEIQALEKLKHLPNVKILLNDFYKMGNVVILGFTLWSYISKRDLIGDICYFSDTNFIKYRNKLLINPKITNCIHLKHKQHLQNLLLGFENYKIIVVTHYLPSLKCIHAKYKYDTFNKAYYSHCDTLIPLADVWCAGHIHNYTNKKISDVPIYVNPVGYQSEYSNYKKDFTFEVN